MTEKRFNLVDLLETLAIADGDECKYYQNCNDDFMSLCKELNALHEENQRLKKAEILANYRGEMVGFATALLDDLGSQTMREMWSEFREEKYK